MTLSMIIHVHTEVLTTWMVKNSRRIIDKKVNHRLENFQDNILHLRSVRFKDRY